MTTPTFGLVEWAEAQASPWIAHNAALRLFEALIRQSVEDRDLAAPPGACADGAAYLIAAAPTGAWSGHAGKLAVAVGTNAANGWLFAVVEHQGFALWVADEQIRIEYAGSAWRPYAIDNGAQTITEAGTSANLLASNVRKFQLWTSNSDKVLTVRPNATHALPTDGEWYIRNVGTANLEIDEGSGVTITPPNGGTLFVPPGGTVGLKRIATDELLLIGLTVAEEE